MYYPAPSPATRFPPASTPEFLARDSECLNRFSCNARPLASVRSVAQLQHRNYCAKPGFLLRSIREILRKRSESLTSIASTPQILRFDPISWPILHPSVGQGDLLLLRSRVDLEDGTGWEYSATPAY